jgi:hypothetical protein
VVDDLMKMTLENVPESQPIINTPFPTTTASTIAK